MTELAQQGVTWQGRVGYSTPVHWAVVVLVLILIGVGLYRRYRLERGPSSMSFRMLLAGVRWLAIALTVIAALNWYVEFRKMRKPLLVVLLDDSLSVNHFDGLEDQSLLQDLKEAGFTEPSRLNVLKYFADRHQAKLRELAKEFEIVSYRFSDKLSELNPDELHQHLGDLSGSGQETLLDDALRQVLADHAGQSLAAIVVASDGLDSREPDFQLSSRSAARMDVPIFVIGMGNRRPAIDLSIDSVEANRRVFLNDFVEFEVDVAADGLAGSRSRIRLFDDSTNTVMAEREIQIRSDSYRDRIRLRARMNRAGKRLFRVQAEALEEEYDPGNNEQTIAIDVRSDQIRVLLVADYPNREFNYLKQFLGRESLPVGASQPERDSTAAANGLVSNDEFAQNRIQLDTLLQQADLDYVATDRHAIPLFPVNPAQLFEYDVVILVDAKPTWAGDRPGGIGRSEFKLIRELVENRGGGLILVAGQNYTPEAYQNSPLEEMIPLGRELVSPSGKAESGSAAIRRPVFETEYSLRESIQGKRFLPMQMGDADLPVEMGQLPGPFWFRTSFETRAGATVLAHLEWNGQLVPAVVLQNYGNGSVLYHAFPETYRWRFRRGDIFFGRYWSQMIQYLASRKMDSGDAGFLLSTDRQQYFRADPVSVQATVLDRAVLGNRDRIAVTLRSAGGTERTLEMRRMPAGNNFEAVVGGLGPGEYVLVAPEFGDVSANFVIADATRENLRRPANRDGLETLAATTGGEFLPVTQLADLPRSLPAAEWIEVGGEPPRYLWQSWQFTVLFACLLVILLSIEWAARKKVGMV